MAVNQKFSEYRVNSLPSSGLQAGDRYYLSVGGGKYKTFIVSDNLVLTGDAGAEYIEKDTMAQMRALSSREIWALQNGYYKGVRLSGYYEKGDTPAPIEYYLSETTEADDGGSVIEVGGIKLEHEFKGVINVLYYGVTGNQIDNVVQLTKLSEFLQRNMSTRRFKVVFPKNNIDGYETSDTLYIPRNTDVEMNSSLYYTGVRDRPALVIGESNVGNERVYLKLDVRAKTLSSWEEEESNFIGIVLINLYECTQVYIERAYGFYEGLRCLGDGSGFVYNCIYLGRLVNNHIGFRGTNSNTSGIGWFNENNIYAGRFGRTSTFNRDKSVYGIILDSLDSTYENNNNNNFYKPSFELLQSTGENTENRAIVLKVGQQNAFFDCRNEGNGPMLMRTEGSAQRNILNVGYGIATYEDLGLFPSTYAVDRQTYLRYNSPGKLIYDSGDLTTKVMQYDSSRAYFSDSLIVGTTNNANKGKLYGLVTSAYEDLIFEERSIRIATTRLLGVRVNATNCKQFRISKSILESPALPRLVINCYDAEGGILTGAEGRYATGDSQLTLGYQSLAGGSYMTSGVNGDIYFAVKPEVKYIDVMLTGHGGAINLLSFQVYALNGYSNVIDPLGKRGLYAIQQPTTTIHKVGTVVYNDAPSNNGEEGWVFCSDNIWRPIGIVGLSNASTTTKGLVSQAAASADTAEQAAGETPTKVEFDALLAELRDLKTKMRAGDAPILSS